MCRYKNRLSKCVTIRSIVVEDETMTPIFNVDDRPPSQQPFKCMEGTSCGQRQWFLNKRLKRRKIVKHGAMNTSKLAIAF